MKQFKLHKNTMLATQNDSLHELQQLHAGSMFVLFLSDVLLLFFLWLFLPFGSQTTVIERANYLHRK